MAATDDGNVGMCCPNCGSMNPETAKLYMECGTKSVDAGVLAAVPSPQRFSQARVKSQVQQKESLVSNEVERKRTSCTHIYGGDNLIDCTLPADADSSFKFMAKQLAKITFPEGR